MTDREPNRQAPNRQNDDLFWSWDDAVGQLTGEWLLTELEDNAPISHLVSIEADELPGTASISNRFSGTKIGNVKLVDGDLILTLTGSSEDGATEGSAHSTRKTASDEADKAGAEVPQTEYRGRWIGDKGKSVVGRIYVRKDDPYTDGYVAGLLCDDGPIKYELQDGLAVTDAITL